MPIARFSGMSWAVSSALAVLDAVAVFPAEGCVIKRGGAGIIGGGNSSCGLVVFAFEPTGAPGWVAARWGLLRWFSQMNWCSCWTRPFRAK